MRILRPPLNDVHRIAHFLPWQQISVLFRGRDSDLFSHLPHLIPWSLDDPPLKQVLQKPQTRRESSPAYRLTRGHPSDGNLVPV